MIIKAAQAVNPPLHLFLGQDAYQLAFEKIDLLKQDLENWQADATATVF